MNLLLRLSVIGKKVAEWKVLKHGLKKKEKKRN